MSPHYHHGNNVVGCWTDTSANRFCILRKGRDFQTIGSKVFIFYIQNLKGGHSIMHRESTKLHSFLSFLLPSFQKNKKIKIQTRTN